MLETVVFPNSAVLNSYRGNCNRHKLYSWKGHDLRKKEDFHGNY